MSWNYRACPDGLRGRRHCGKPAADCGAAPPRRRSVAHNSCVSRMRNYRLLRGRSHRSSGRTDPGSLKRAACASARTARVVHLMVGMIERAGDKYYDDAILFTPEGAYHVYRKTHLFGPERAIFTPGEQPVVVDTVLGRLGLTVCYDLMFPEFIRTLVLSGAQVILNATDWITDTWQSTVGWDGDTVSLAGTHPRAGEWRPRRHGRPRGR